MQLLSLEKVVAGYGGIVAIKGIDLSVNSGEIVTLIGSNGAGKSTTLRTISGLLRARSGRITFKDRDITRMPPHRIVGLGISHVPEGRGIFHRLTVLENLQLGAFQRNDNEIDADLDRVFELFPRLKERARQTSGTLSGGEQQMLAIGRALMASPTLLLLDEPSLGVAPQLSIAIYRTLKRLNEEGTTILLVEQNARLALAVAHRAYILRTGQVALHGTTEELRENDEVRKIYLGIN